MSNSVLCEYGVIGSLLLDESLFPEVSGLSSEDFSLLPLREVFRVMRRQYMETGSFDALTICAEAARHCPEVTDDLLVRTMEITPTTANLPVYVSGMKEASMARRLHSLGTELTSAEYAPQEALNHAREVIENLSEDGASAGDSVQMLDVLNRLRERVNGQMDGAISYVASGLNSFDKLLGGGFVNGGLHVIGARPAVGKSAVAMQIALNAARRGTKTLYVTLEMSSQDCAARLAGNIGGLSSARLMFGSGLTEQEYQRFASGASELSTLPIVFNGRYGLTLHQLEALCYREKPSLLIIDHMGLLAPAEKKMNFYEATTQNSRGLKLLALRMNIPVLCLCQLNRAAAADRGGSFRATMANLRESGAIEQDADTVTLLHNPPCYTDGKPEAPSLLEMWLDKNRRGPTGHIDATFFKVTGRVVA